MTLPDPLAWHAHRACNTVDPDLFFPERGETGTAARIVCACCPVRTECLAYALERKERYGIWGGYSEQEFRKLRRGQHVDPRLPVAPLRKAMQAIAATMDTGRANGTGSYVFARTYAAAAGTSVSTLMNFLVGDYRSQLILLSQARRLCEAVGQPDLPAQLWPMVPEARRTEAAA